MTKAWDYQDQKNKELPKTEASVRTVPTEPTLRPLLERVRKGKPVSALVVPTLSNFGTSA